MREKPVIVAWTLIALLVVCIAIFAVSWKTSEAFLSPGADPPFLQEDRYDFELRRLPAEPIVRVKSADGLLLKGWVLKGNRPETIVLVHGAGGSHREMVPHAEYLWKHGFTVVFYDARARGDSQGRFVTMGVEEPGDVLAVVEWAGAQEGTQWVGVLGISLGAACAILATASEDPRARAVRAVVAESPFPSLTEAIDNGIRAEAGLPRIPFAKTAKWAAEWHLNADFDQIRPSQRIQQVAPRPLLLIHDELEHMFAETSFDAMAGRGGDTCTSVKIPHAFHGQGWQALQRWTDFYHQTTSTRVANPYERMVIAFWERAIEADASKSERFLFDTPQSHDN